MTAPVFEDIDPASGCDCPGRVHRRRTEAAVVAAASAVPPAAALAPGRFPHRQALPGTPQGAGTPLRGRAGQPAGSAAGIPAATRTDIADRAGVPVAARVPHSMDAYGSHGHRRDRSGHVRTAWGLPGDGRTGSLDRTGAGKGTRPGEAAPGGAARRRAPGCPGRRRSRPGAADDRVTRLGVQLVRKGCGRFCAHGPGPHRALRRAVQAFRRARGRGGAKDRYPAPETWRRLFG
ncbi:hypothetical protein [Streptomyces sp. NPDC006193]|uniref:hypothetical protein n=1 Tax=Streptomyces sp. NPDC006193 TaxID=3155717 RepID=UPI0033AA486D